MILVTLTPSIILDDLRPTPDGWVHVYWPDEAINLLKTGQVEEISLDHDLGDDNRGTGYDVVLWIEEAVAADGFIPPTIKVHPANTAARQHGSWNSLYLKIVECLPRYPV